MKKVRYVKQSNLKDCASSCIYNIIRYYKGNINYNSITKKLHITKKGSSIYNVVKTLRYYKLEANAYRCDYNNLLNLNHPVIAYLKIDNYYHYVVIKKIKNNKIYIFDPIRGNLIYSKDEFYNEWQEVIIDINCHNKLQKEKSSYMNFLKRIIKENILLLFLILFIVTLYTLSNLSGTYFIKYIIDEFDFKKVIVFITVFEVLKNALSFINGKLMIKAYIKINTKIRESIYQKIFNLPNKEAKGFNLICRIEDLSCISEFIFNFPELLINILYIVIIIIFYFVKRLLYPYILLILIVLMLSFHLFFRNRLIDFFDKERNNFIKLNNSLIEKISLIPIIFKLKANKEFINKEINNYKDYLLFQKKLNNNMLYYSLILNIFYIFINFVVILISFHYNSLNQISLGDFYINYILFQMCFSSIINVLNFDKLFLSSKNAFKRIVDLYNYDYSGEVESINKPLVIESNEPLLVDTIDNNIMFERDISKYELDKVKKVCLINNNELVDNDLDASIKEKIILARSILSNNNTIILNNCMNNLDSISKKIIIKNIMTEYNKKIIYRSNKFCKKKGGKCEKVRYL